MKLNLTEEWCRRMAEQEAEIDQGGCIACSPEIAALAKELATARGHRDVDALITCTNGAKLPVWQFYVSEAALQR